MRQKKNASRTINVHEAKTSLSKLLAQVEDGGEVIIARAGRPIARLVRYEAAARIPGPLEGLCDVPDDFDDIMSKEIEEMFYP